MRYGLTEEIICKINTVLASHPSIEKAVLFGSRAKGNFKPGSDIDLSLYGETISSKELGEISSELDDLLLPYSIDLTIFNDLDHAKLRDHIERVGKVFYHRGRVVGCQGSAVKAGWKLSTLGSLCDILDSQRKPITKRDRTPGEYPYYGATGVQDYVQGYLFDEPLILVGEDGAKWASGENTAFAIKGKCWVNNHAHVLRPYRTVLMDNWLIHYFVHSDLSSFVSGLTVPKLNQGSLRGIPIPLPPLPEQQRIVSILDKAFEGIATAKANAEKNLQNARSIFDSHLQSVFTHQGEGWVEKQLSSLCHKITVGHVGSMAKQYKECGIPFLRSQNIRPFKVDLENVVFINDAFHSSLAKSRLRPGDLAIVRTGYPGTAAVIPSELPDANCSDLVIVRTGPEVSPYYLAAFFNSSYGKELVSGKIVGAAQKHFNVKAAKEVMLNVPPISQQEIIMLQLDTLRTETHRLESIYQQKLAALDALKKSLLDQAFNGQL